MRARALKTHLRVVVALSIAAAVVIGLVACAAGRPRRPTTRSRAAARSVHGERLTAASAIVRRTFDFHRPIASGRVSLAMTLAADGSGPAHDPFSLRLTGPFQCAGAERTPRFAFQIGLREGSHDFHVGASSIAGQLFLELHGTAFRAPASALRALQLGYASASQAPRSHPDGKEYTGLGIDPGGWLQDPREAGTARVAGVSTAHLVAGLNTAAFLRDAGRLWGLAGTLGSWRRTAGGSLPLSSLSSLVDSAHSARVDLYTGRGDRLLRRLAVSVTLSTTPRTRVALGGLRRGVLRLELRFADLNRPQTIEAPRRPRTPYSSSSSSSSGSSSSSSSSGSSSAGSSPPG